MSLHTGLDEIHAAELPHFSIGAIIGRALWILIWNLISFIGMAIVITLPFAVIVGILYWVFPFGRISFTISDWKLVAGDWRQVMVWVAYLFLILVNFLMVQAAVAYRTFHSLSGRRASFGACLARSLAVLLHLGEAALIIMAVAALIATAGLSIAAWFFAHGGAFGLNFIEIVTAMLGIFVLNACWVVLPVMTVERIGPVVGIVRSWQLTAGRRWHILVVMVIFAVIEAAISYGFSANLSLQFGAVGLEVPFSFFAAIVMASSYYHLVGEKEGITRLAVIFA